MLRVALVQGGRIVEDRTFPPRTSVTVGTAPDCTFLVPMADVPERATVFEASRRGVSLVFEPGTDGRVTNDSFNRSLLELEASATREGKRCVVPLDTKSKGRIAVGEVSLLFQFVEPSVKPVPGELPKGARGLMAQIDRSFLVILGLSLAAHFAGLGWVSSQPVPVENELTVDEQVDRFVAIKLPLPKPAAPTTAAPTNDEPKPPVAEAPRPRPDKRPTAVATGPSMRERTNVGMVRLIGSIGGQDGAFGDLLRDSNVSDVAKALDGATKLQVASIDDATAAKQKGDQQGTKETVDLPGTDGVKRVELTDKEVAKLDPKVKTEIVEVGGTEIPEDELSRWLNHRKSAVQSCYERELKRSPRLQGRVVIRFGVTPRGRVDHVGFSEDTLKSPAVQTCISNMMKGWVLPFTPEDEVPVALPFIFSANR